MPLSFKIMGNPKAGNRSASGTTTKAESTMGDRTRSDGSSSTASSSVSAVSSTASTHDRTSATVDSYLEELANRSLSTIYSEDEIEKPFDEESDMGEDDHKSRLLEFSYHSYQDDDMSNSDIFNVNNLDLDDYTRGARAPTSNYRFSMVESSTPTTKHPVTHVASFETNSTIDTAEDKKFHGNAGDQDDTASIITAKSTTSALKASFRYSSPPNESQQSQQIGIARQSSMSSDTSVDIDEQPEPHQELLLVSTIDVRNAESPCVFDSVLILDSSPPEMLPPSPSPELRQNYRADVERQYAMSPESSIYIDEQSDHPSELHLDTTVHVRNLSPSSRSDAGSEYSLPPSPPKSPPPPAKSVVASEYSSPLSSLKSLPPPPPPPPHVRRVLDSEYISPPSPPETPSPSPEPQQNHQAEVERQYAISPGPSIEVDEKLEILHRENTLRVRNLSPSATSDADSEYNSPPSPPKSPTPTVRSLLDSEYSLPPPPPNSTPPPPSFTGSYDIETGERLEKIEVVHDESRRPDAGARKRKITICVMFCIMMIAVSVVVGIIVLGPDRSSNSSAAAAATGGNGASIEDDEGSVDPPIIDGDEPSVSLPSFNETEKKEPSSNNTDSLPIDDVDTPPNNGTNIPSTDDTNTSPNEDADSPPNEDTDIPPNEDVDTQPGNGTDTSPNDNTNISSNETDKLAPEGDVTTVPPSVTAPPVAAPTDAPKNEPPQCLNVVAADKSCYKADTGTILLLVTACNPLADDWVGIYRAGSSVPPEIGGNYTVSDDYLEWSWTCGSQGCARKNDDGTRTSPGPVPVIVLPVDSLQVGETYYAHLVRDAPSPPFVSDGRSEEFVIRDQCP